MDRNCTPNKKKAVGRLRTDRQKLIQRKHQTNINSENHLPSAKLRNLPVISHNFLSPTTMAVGSGKVFTAFLLLSTIKRDFSSNMDTQKKFNLTIIARNTEAASRYKKTHVVSHIIISA
jgi:hypothetical protein